MGIGLAVVSGVKQPHPSGQLRGDVDDALAVFEESLPERPAGAVAALDCPDPFGPGARVLPHRCVAGPVSGEPTRAEHLLVLVDDLDGRRQLVGIDPMITCCESLFMYCSRLFDPMWTARWALLLRAGQSRLEPRLVTVTGGPQTESEPHQNSRWAAAKRAARRSPEPSLARHRS